MQRVAKPDGVVGRQKNRIGVVRCGTYALRGLTCDRVAIAGDLDCDKINTRSHSESAQHYHGSLVAMAICI